MPSRNAATEAAISHTTGRQRRLGRPPSGSNSSGKLTAITIAATIASPLNTPSHRVASETGPRDSARQTAASLTCASANSTAIAASSGPSGARRRRVISNPAAAASGSNATASTRSPQLSGRSPARSHGSTTAPKTNTASKGAYRIAVRDTATFS
jgi:hypothetical protein